MADKICPIHNVKFEYHVKELPDGTNKPWWGHKLADGKYCFPQKEVKPTITPAEHQAVKEAVAEVHKAPVTDPKNKSFALSYAKDLCAAGKITVSDILPTAEDFLIWLNK